MLIIEKSNSSNLFSSGFEANLLFNSFDTKGCWIPRQWLRQITISSSENGNGVQLFLFFFPLSFSFLFLVGKATSEFLHHFLRGATMELSQLWPFEAWGRRYWWIWSSFLISNQPFAKQYLCFQSPQMHSYLKKQIINLSLQFHPETVAVALFSQPIKR